MIAKENNEVNVDADLPTVVFLHPPSSHDVEISEVTQLEIASPFEIDSKPSNSSPSSRLAGCEPCSKL